jgi:hypothetical protein
MQVKQQHATTSIKKQVRGVISPHLALRGLALRGRRLGKRFHRIRFRLHNLLLFGQMLHRKSLRLGSTRKSLIAVLMVRNTACMFRSRTDILSKQGHNMSFRIANDVIFVMTVTEWGRRTNDIILPTRKYASWKSRGSYLPK